MKKLLSLILALLMVLGLTVQAFAEEWVWEDGNTITISAELGKENYLDYKNAYVLSKGDFDSWQTNDGTLAGLATKCFVSAVCADEGNKNMSAKWESGSSTKGEFTKVPLNTDNKIVSTFDMRSSAPYVLVLSNGTDYYSNNSTVTSLTLESGYVEFKAWIPSQANPTAFSTPAPEEDGKSGNTTITATVAKPELEYEIIIPSAVTMNEAGVVEIGAATINTAEGKLKNATANTVISYTASGTNFTLKDGDATMPARYYSEYTKNGDQLISYTELTTESFDVYKNSALVDPLTKLYVGVSQSDWDTAAQNNPGTYTATVTYNFSAKEEAAKVTIASILPDGFPVFPEDGYWKNENNCKLYAGNGNLGVEGVVGYGVTIPVSTEVTLEGEKYTCSKDNIKWTFTMDGEKFIKVNISGAQGIDSEVNGDYQYN